MNEDVSYDGRFSLSVLREAIGVILVVNHQIMSVCTTI